MRNDSISFSFSRFPPPHGVGSHCAGGAADEKVVGLAGCAEVFAEKLVPVGEECVVASRCGHDADVGVVGDGCVCFLAEAGIVGGFGECDWHDVLGEELVGHCGALLAGGRDGA